MKDTNWINNDTENSISSAILDLIDVRNALSDRIKNKPKDNDGTETTIGDCLDDAINYLQSLVDDQKYNKQNKTYGYK